MFRHFWAPVHLSSVGPLQPDNNGLVEDLRSGPLGGLFKDQNLIRTFIVNIVSVLLAQVRAFQNQKFPQRSMRKASSPSRSAVPILLVLRVRVLLLQLHVHWPRDRTRLRAVGLPTLLDAAPRRRAKRHVPHRRLQCHRSSSVRHRSDLPEQ